MFSLIWIIPLILFLSVGQFFYNNEEYPLWLSNITYADSKFESTNIVIGDSRAIAAIHPKMLGESYYNLALGGGTPLEGYYTLKTILKNGNNIKLLIVSYSPTHLEWADTFFERAIKYDFYGIKEINEIFFNLNSDNEIFWSKTDQKLSREYMYKNLVKSFLLKFKYPLYYRNELKNSLLQPRLFNNIRAYNEIKENRGYYTFGSAEFSDELNIEASVGSLMIKNIFIRSLDSIFTIAKNNKINVIYKSTPFNKSSYNAIDKNFIKIYNTLFNNLKRKYPEVVFNSELFFYNDSYFGDPSHLNTKGKDKFCNELKAEIADMYY